MSKYRQEYLGTVADDLGSIRNRIAELKSAEKVCCAILEDADVEAAEGETFRVTVTKTLRTTINWRAIAERTGFSTQLLTANTKRKTVVRINTNAKTGDKVAA
jgi:hypothetical protein